MITQLQLSEPDILPKVLHSWDNGMTVAISVGGVRKGVVYKMTSTPYHQSKSFMKGFVSPPRRSRRMYPGSRRKLSKISLETTADTRGYSIGGETDLAIWGQDGVSKNKSLLIPRGLPSARPDASTASYARRTRPVGSSAGPIHRRKPRSQRRRPDEQEPAGHRRVQE